MHHIRIHSPVSCKFHPLSAFGWKVHFIDDERHLQVLKQKFVTNATIVNNNEAFGWIFGKWFVGYIYLGFDRYRKFQQCYILAQKAMMDRVTQFTDCDSSGKAEVFIRIYEER